MCTPSTPTTCTVPEHSITVAVPVYDNAGSLPALHARLMSVLTGMGSEFEIVYVNDASNDESFEWLARLHAAADRVTVVDLAENVGQSAAVLAALRFARGEIVVTIDADLENHPEDIPALVAAVRNGADLACGVRGRRSAPLVTRKGPSLIANRLVGLALGIDLADWGCGLNAVGASLLRQLLAQDPPPLLPKIEATLLAARIAQVPVGYSEREHGRSGYTVRRLGTFAATFLRGFAIARTLRRLLGNTTVTTGRLSTGDPAAQRSVVAGALRSTVALAAWAALTAAALVVRAWQWRGRTEGAERFRVRALLAARGRWLPEPLLRGAARNRPGDIVSRCG